MQQLTKTGKDILHAVNYTTETPEAYETMCEITMAYAEQNGLMYRETNNNISKGSEVELADVLLKYKKSAIVISSALHGCIIGVAMGIKVIAVSGDWKIDAFMESVGLQDWVINYDETQKLPGLLNDIDNQPDSTLHLSSIKLANEKVEKKIRQFVLG